MATCCCVCGKIIVPTKPELDSQLDVLAERGRANGAKVEIINSEQLSALARILAIDVFPIPRVPVNKYAW